MIVQAAKWDAGFEPGFGKTAALLVSDNPNEKWDKESYPYLSFGPHQPDSPLQQADLTWLMGRSLDTAKMIVRGWEVGA